MKEAAIYRVNAFKDPISNFLFSKWQNFFVILLIFFSLQVIASFHSGTLIKIDTALIPQERVDEVVPISTMKDLPFMFTYLAAVGLFFFVRRFFLYIPQAFQTLFTNKIFKKKKGSTRENVLINYNESLREFENTINAKYMYVPAFLLHLLVIGTFVILIEPIPYLDVVLWYNFHFFPLNWTILIIVAPLMWFMAGILIWKVYCIVSFTKRLTHLYEFDLNPCSIDKFGGFKPLGQLWINIALVIVPILLYHTAIFIYNRYSELSYPLRQKYIDLAIVILYTIGIIVFLIYPMKEYHDIVKVQKLKLLGRINVKIIRLWKIVREPLLSGKDEDLVRSSEKQLERSLQLVHAVRRIPSWPFTPSERIGILLIAIIPWMLEIMHYLG